MLDESGKFLLKTGADAQIVQGLMAITAIAVNGLSAFEVAKLSPNYVEEMGLKSSLTPSRANGFLNMFRRVISEAEVLAEI
jgi:cysteine desulfuration protein SufE